MEKLSHATENNLDENVEKLAELFPEVVTEVREPDGSLRHTIDVEALKERVGDVAEGQRERYQFTWPGKRDAKQEAYRPIDKCLRPCPEESVNWDTTENLYIEGDNLDALKLLRNTYAGKIKMIYIDPPYNTGHDFIYDDDFARTKDDYDAESGDYDEDGGRLVANPESNGRFHSDWCSMMYPRLLLARDLLSEDGAIYVNIDFNEVQTLRLMMDEIFGRNNFQRELIWRIGWLSGYKTVTPNYVRNHDTILFYSRSDSKLYFNKEYLRNENFKPLLRDSANVKSFLSELGLSKDDQIKLLNFINHDNRPDRYPLEDTWNCNEYDDLNSIAIVSFSGEKVSKILGVDQDFVGQKSLSLIRRMLVASCPKEGVALDFFSGSATTAHTVMKLNAEDGGNRKFIMVQLPEVCGPETEAAKAGYKNICEIGKERIRRAGKKIADEVEQSNRQLKLGEEPKKVPDIGFRVLKIDSSNFEDVLAEPAAYTQESLMGLTDNLKAGRTAEDILFQVMPQFQIPLSTSIERKSINGSTVFSVDDGRLVACFDRDVSTDTIAEMAKMEPDYAVMRDASFAGDDAVSNFGELFKTYSPATITRVV